MKDEYFHAPNVNTKLRGKKVFEDIQTQFIRAKYFHALNVNMKQHGKEVFKYKNLEKVGGISDAKVHEKYFFATLDRLVHPVSRVSVFP